MTDVVDKLTRSRMMSGIRGKDTKPEIQVRKGLHRLGFRFALHKRKLPGRPDLVLPKYGAVIFVHGCYWHRHPACDYATTPATRPDFWQEKFEKNVERDSRNVRELRESGWRVFTVWECALRHQSDKTIDELAGVLKSGGIAQGEFPKEPVRRKK